MESPQGDRKGLTLHEAAAGKKGKKGREKIGTLADNF